MNRNEPVYIRHKLQMGPYRMPFEDVAKSDSNCSYVVPDTNIFLHFYDAIEDLLQTTDNSIRIFVTEEVRREIDKKKSISQTAQTCLKEIYSKLSANDPKLQGQSLDAYNAYAGEDVHGDLNILYSCLQLQPHVCKLILLTSDIGFSSLAKINQVQHCNIATIATCLDGTEISEPPASTVDQDIVFLPNYDALEAMSIRIKGDNVPPCVYNFSDCQFDSRLNATLENVAAYEKMTLVQRYGIPLVLAGRDVIIYSNTGSGKTATYLLPIIDNILKNYSPAEAGSPIALILSPTRDLAIQVRLLHVNRLNVIV